MPGSIVGAVVSSAVSAGASKLFGGGGGGGGAGQVGLAVPSLGVSAPGFNVTPGANGFTASLTQAARKNFFDLSTVSRGSQAVLQGRRRQLGVGQGLVSRARGELRKGGARTERELLEIQNRLRPGFGALTEARVRAIQDARGKAIGNLRENLGRRRVLGSSFAEAAQAQAEREFGQAEAEARATSTLQELDATSQLIQTRAAERSRNIEEQAALITQQQQLLGASAEAGIGIQEARINDILRRFNIESDIGKIAANMTQNLQNAFAGIANTQQQLAAQAAAGRGQFIGGITAPIADKVGGFVSDAVGGFFGGGSDTISGDATAGVTV